MHQSEPSPLRGESLVAFIPVVLYGISAAILAIIAAVLLYEGIETTISALGTGIMGEVSTEIYGSLFHAATAIALLETIEVFYRKHRFAFEMLFLAGVAEVIRHILIYDLSSIGRGDLVSMVVLLGFLLSGLLFARNIQSSASARRKKRQRGTLVSRITRIALPEKGRHPAHRS